MSKWSNPEEWARLCSGETCPICLDGGRRDIIAELETSWLTTNENSPLHGYCCLVFKRHAVELHDLTEEEGAAYMRDIQKVSRALKTVTGAVKIELRHPRQRHPPRAHALLPPLCRRPLGGCADPRSRGAHAGLCSRRVQRICHSTSGGARQT